jgi:hypothetical protein
MDHRNLLPETNPTPARSKWPMVVILGLIIACVVLPVLSAAWPAERARWLLAAAANALEESHENDDKFAERTRELLRQAIEVDPSIKFSTEFMELNLITGELDADEANEILLSAPEKNRPLVAYRISQIFAKNREFNVAFDFLKRGFPELDQRPARICNDFAYFAALSDQDLDEALLSIDHALQSIDNSGLVDTKAWVLFKLERLDDALKAIDESISKFDVEVKAAALTAAERKALTAFRTEPIKNSLQASPKKLENSGGGNRNLQEWFRQLAVYQYHRKEILEKLGRKEEALQIVDWLKNRGYHDLEKLH